MGTKYPVRSSVSILNYTLLNQDEPLVGKRGCKCCGPPFLQISSPPVKKLHGLEEGSPDPKTGSVITTSDEAVVVLGRSLTK